MLCGGRLVDVLLLYVHAIVATDGKRYYTVSGNEKIHIPKSKRVIIKEKYLE